MSEDRAHFAMWCMLAAPLIAGNDLRNMSAETREILTNKEVIAVDQDALGIQAYKYATADSVETWIKPLKNNEVAICFLNRSANSQKINFNWKEHPIKDDLSKTYIDFNQTEYRIKDIETGKERGKTKPAFEAVVSSHDVVMIRLSKL